MREEWKQIEAVLDEKVRPSLRAHGGELEIDHLEDGVLYIKLLGQCALSRAAASVYGYNIPPGCCTGFNLPAKLLISCKLFRLYCHQASSP